MINSYDIVLSIYLAIVLFGILIPIAILIWRDVFKGKCNGY